MKPSAAKPRVMSRRHSVPEGDLVLAIAPPYLASPWMGIGVPLLHGVLAAESLTARVVRFLDDPLDTPEDIVDTCTTTLWGDPTFDERMTAMRRLADRHGAWFDRMLELLLAGPEKVFGFSIWRHNADVTIELTRRLKAARPDCIIIFGGPEALESLEELTQDWIDVVVAGAAEGLVGKLVRACLEGEVRKMAAFEGVWIHPRHRPAVHLLRHRAEIPPLSPIDYKTLLPLFLVERWQSVPVLLNIGCPFRCGFCTNTSLYPEANWGSAERLVDEIKTIAEAWVELFEGEPPILNIEFCDATVNAQPAQFDRFLRAIARATLPVRPTMHGCFVVDHRVTAPRVRALLAAGFNSIFFGLESASPRVRRAMKKPGTIGSVRRALTTIREVGAGRMKVNFNFIVGWPDETELEYQATLSFVEWAASLGIVTDIGAMPLVRTTLAMDTELFAHAGGAGKGVAWESSEPAGSAELRCRRFMGVFERFHRILPVTSVLPRKKVIRWMMPDLPDVILDGWISVHGEDNLRGLPFSVMLQARRADEMPLTTTGAELEGDTFASRIEQWLEPVLLVGSELSGGWVLQGVYVAADPRAAVLLFEHFRDERLAAMYITPLDNALPAFQRLRQFNVSYMEKFRDDACVVDIPLTRAVCTLIARHERSAAFDAIEAAPDFATASA
jgi:hypothetical protein